MAKSKTDKTRNQKLVNFKNKTKNMNENTQPQSQQHAMNQEPTMPEVREVPYWGSNDDLEIKGIEFEKIYNTIQEMQYMIQGLFAAANSVMQRNIFNDKINVRFEKLSDVVMPDGTNVKDYVEMTEDEQAPHKEQFRQLVESLKENKASAMKQADQNIPSLESLVNEDGNPIGETRQIVDVSGSPISSN